LEIYLKNSNLNNHHNSDIQALRTLDRSINLINSNDINFVMQNSNISQNEVNISYCFEELVDLENVAN